MRRQALILPVLLLAACSDGTGPSEASVAQVIVTPSTLELVPDEAVQLSAQAVDAGGDPVSGVSIAWSSSNPAVADVSAAGLVTGLSAGSVRIEATVNGETGASDVEVLAAAVRPETAVLDSTVYELLSDSTERAAGSYRFRVSGDAETPEAGDVIAGAEGAGFLRRVTSASRSGDVITLDTEHAALADALAAGRLTTRAVLDPSAGPQALPIDPEAGESVSSVVWGRPEVIPLVEGVKVNSSGLSLDNLTVLGIETCNESGSECGRVALEVEEGDITFTPTFEMDVEFGLTGLKRALVVATGDFDFDARMQFYSAVKFERSKVVSDTLVIAEMRYPWAALVGGLPVKGTIVFEISAGLEWNIEGALGLQTGLVHNTSITLGTEFDGTAWREIAEGQSDTQGVEPQWTASASSQAKVFIKPEIKAFIYESIGPTSSLEGFFALNAAVDLTRWTVGATFGLDFSVGAEAKIPVFDRTIAKIEKTWRWAELPIGEWEGEWDGFTLSLQPDALSLAIGQSKLLAPVGIRDDGSEVAVTSSLTWVTSSPNVATVTPDGLVEAVGAGTATITARTQSGSTATTAVDVLPVRARPSASVFNSALQSTADQCAVVDIGLSVFDLNGAPLPTLDAASVSFPALEWSGGESLTTTILGVEGVTSATRGPMSVALLIDQSGSMRQEDPQNARFAAAKQFAGETQPDDEYALFSFNSSVNRWTDLITDESEFRAAVDALGGATGQTRLYDGVDEACRYLGGSSNPNRALVVLTDGDDTQSARSLQQAMRTCEASAVRVYSVGFAGAVPATLSELSLGTGGSVVHDVDVDFLLSAVRALPGTIRGGTDGSRVTVEACRTAGRVDEGGTIGGRIRVSLGSAGSAGPLTHSASASGSDFVSAPFFVDVPEATASSLFATTPDTYPVDVDADAVCRSQFGSTFRNTDWGDIKAALASGMSIDEIRDPQYKHAWTTYQGDTHYSSSRRYFASLYPVSSGYLIHHRLDENGDTSGTPVIVMGSWDLSYHVSCTTW